MLHRLQLGAPHAKIKSTLMELCSFSCVSNSICLLPVCVCVYVCARTRVCLCVPRKRRYHRNSNFCSLCVCVMRGYRPCAPPQRSNQIDPRLPWNLIRKRPRWLTGAEGAARTQAHKNPQLGFLLQRGQSLTAASQIWLSLYIRVWLQSGHAE